MIYEPSPHPAPPVSLVFPVFSSSNSVPKSSPPTLPSDHLAISGRWSAGPVPGGERVCTVCVGPSVLSLLRPFPRWGVSVPGVRLDGRGRPWPKRLGGRAGCGSGNRGPAGWIPDSQGHGARGNCWPTPEQRPLCQSAPRLRSPHSLIPGSASGPLPEEAQRSR